MFKKLILGTFSICLILIVVFVLLGDIFVKQFFQSSNRNSTEITGYHRDKHSRERGAPGFEKWYFEQWHYPDGANLELNKLSSIWKNIQSMPKEDDNSSPDWQNIGPYGSLTDRNSVFTGRVLDVNVGTSGKVMIGAASGGLWEVDNSQTTHLSSMLNTSVASSFDVQPGDPSIILLGTGEDYVRGGTGLYRTVNGGLNWTAISMGASTPQHFHLIRYSPLIPTLVHAGTSMGYFRSNDGGLSWTQVLPNNAVTDIAFHPTDPNVIYLGRWDNGNGLGGLYKSLDAGATWTRQTSGDIPTSNVGKTLISISAQHPDNMYCLMSKDNTDVLYGIYKTTNAGSNWINVSPPSDILDGLGWYLGALGVCPTDPNICLAGGIWLWRTSNGGQNWSEINYFNDINAKIHVDFHSIIWENSGNSVWIGHDGGISNSTDNGVTYNTNKNVFPITQYVNFDVCGSNPDYIFGGSRDNAFTGTTNYGTTWKYIFNGGADGGGAAIDPANPNEIYGTLGALGGSWLFGRFYSTNFGTDWTQINSGIDPSQQFYTKIRTDNSPPLTIFANADKYLYYSTNKGTNWIKRNSSAFNVTITNFTLKKYGVSSDPVIYVCLNSSQTGHQLQFQSGGGLFEDRSAELPDGISVRTVTLHPTDENTAYAVMNGLQDGKKVYKTTNQGLNWTNNTGDLPNVPAGDLVVHPTLNDVLYLGSEMGFMKTTNGGTNWFRWNSGVPEAVIVTEMKSFIKNGELYIIASTYGNSIWTRKDTDNPLPVQLASFNSTVNGRDVNLKWATYSEQNNSHFNVERKNTSDENWNMIGKVTGSGNSNEIRNYTFADKGVNTGTYNYRLKQVDYNGNYEYHNLSNAVVIGVPNKYELSQNYPNPFNPTTKIDFQLPRDSKVMIKLYDVSGREVRTIVNEKRTAGFYTVGFDASGLSSGVYFYTIIAGFSGTEFVGTKKMVVVK